jgi:hypothetical protein
MATARANLRSTSRVRARRTASMSLCSSCETSGWLMKCADCPRADAARSGRVMDERPAIVESALRLVDDQRRESPVALGRS